MILELEEKDIEAIARKVVELIKPFLPREKPGEEEHIFDVRGLSEYLQVPLSWIYKQVSLNAIPYFKSGKYVRFKKSAIDKWIDTHTIRPIPLEGTGQRMTR
jgi:excisionase family DNA binding protein